MLRMSSRDFAYLTSAGGGTLMILLVYTGDLSTAQHIANQFRSHGESADQQTCFCENYARFHN